MPVTSVKTIIGRMSGIVTWRITFQLEAPSTLPASYNSEGIPCKPARNKITQPHAASDGTTRKSTNILVMHLKGSDQFLFFIEVSSSPVKARNRTTARHHEMLFSRKKRCTPCCIHKGKFVYTYLSIIYLPWHVKR